MMFAWWWKERRGSEKSDVSQTGVVSFRDGRDERDSTKIDPRSIKEPWLSQRQRQGRKEKENESGEFDQDEQ